MFNIRKANIFFVVYTTLIFFVMIPFIYYINSLLNVNTTLSLLIIALELTIFHLIILRVYMSITKQSAKIMFPIKKPLNKNIFFTVMLSILIVPLILLIKYYSQGFERISFDIDLNQSTSLFISNNLPIIASVIAFAIVPAIFQELIFRGVIFTNYASISVHKNIVIVSILYSLVQFNFVLAICAFIYGLLLGYLRYYTNSLWCSILSHLIISTIVVTNVFETFLVKVGVVSGDLATLKFSVLVLVSIGLFLLMFKSFRSFNISMYGNPEKNYRRISNN